MILLHLFTALFFSFAGFCLYLILLNRVVIHWVESRFKVCFMLFVLALFTAGPFVFGLSVGPSPWLLLPAGMILAFGIGETRQAWLRRIHLADDPIAVENHGISIDRPVTTLHLATLRYRVLVPHLSRERFRVVHISDLHVAENLPPDYFTRVMNQAAEQEPDVLIITGDFVSRKPNVALLPEVLAQARARLGVFAILGNHDYWCAPEQVRQAVSRAGITLLSNQCIHPGGDPSVLLCGCEGPWGPKLTLPNPASPRPLVLALTHTPDNIYRLSRLGIDAVFAGHYHAGQLRIPYLGALVVPSVFGRRFDHGHFLMNDTHLFVSAGIGSGRPPIRIYCQPDMIVVDFVKQ